MVFKRHIPVPSFQGNFYLYSVGRKICTRYFCHFLNLIMWLTEIYIKNWKRGTLRIELTISWYVKLAPTSHQQQDWSSQCVPFEVDFWLMHPTLNSIQRIGISKKFMFHLCATQEAFFFTFASLLLYYLFRKWNFLFLQGKIFWLRWVKYDTQK